LLTRDSMRILGVDIGSFSIKAVEIDLALGRYEIEECHEVSLGAQTQEEALAGCIQNLKNKPHRVITALASGSSTFRNLQFPTRKKKDIQTSLSFELEDELPFSSEVSLHDYVILNQGPEGSLIHVATTIKSYLEDLLTPWKALALSPDFVTTELAAYQAFFNRWATLKPQLQPVLFIQMGHQKTRYYLHWKTKIVLLHEIHWGGWHLTNSIAQEYQMPCEEAEAFKRQLILDDSWKQAQAHFRDLVFGIKKVQILAHSLLNEAIGSIYLAGGTALLRGLCPWLAELTEIPTSLLPSFRCLGIPSSYTEEKEAKFSLAMALAWNAGNRSQLVNFRKGVFAPVSQAKSVDLQGLRRPLIAFVVVIFSLFSSLFVQSQLTKTRLEETNAVLEKNIRSFFGVLSPSAVKTYLKSPQTLKSAIQKELIQHRALNLLFSFNPQSPLELLNKISLAIPKDIVSDLIEFQSGSLSADASRSEDRKTVLSFLVTNPQMVERLMSALSAPLTDLEKDKVAETQIKDAEHLVKKWKVIFSGKPR